MKENKEIILIILGVFIFFGFAWGPVRNAKLNKEKTSTSSTTPFFSSLFRTQTTPTTQTTTQKKVTERDISAQIKKTEKAAESLQKKLETEKEKSLRSPYYGKVNLSSISYLNNPDPNKEYMSISSNIGKGEKVVITGWKLESVRSGNWVKLGKASVSPDPEKNAAIQNYTNVILEQGDKAYIIKGFSPINISFRTNKCTGYFEENRTFYPALRRQCPLAKNEELPQFSTVLDREDECVALISKIPVCSTVTSRYKNLNKLPDTVTDSCKKYLETEINYNACVATHLGDTDFPGREWYLYLKIFGPLWRNKNEKIILYDSSGLIVDSIEY